MKHIAWVFYSFQTHSDRCRFRAERVWDGCGLGKLAGWVGCGLEVCGAGACKISQIPAGVPRERTKNFNLCRILLGSIGLTWELLHQPACWGECSCESFFSTCVWKYLFQLAVSYSRCIVLLPRNFIGWNFNYTRSRKFQPVTFSVAIAYCLHWVKDTTLKVTTKYLPGKVPRGF